MLASHVHRGTAIMLAAVLLAVLAGSSQDVEPSALEKDPSGLDRHAGQHRQPRWKDGLANHFPQEGSSTTSHNGLSTRRPATWSARAIEDTSGCVSTRSSPTSCSTSNGGSRRFRARRDITQAFMYAILQTPKCGTRPSAATPRADTSSAKACSLTLSSRSTCGRRWRGRW